MIGGTNVVSTGCTSRLVFMTTAIAMLQILQDRQFPYTHLVIDEVHDRSVYVDILLAIVKSGAFLGTKDLKVLLMSAAADTSKLAEYFSQLPGSLKLLPLQSTRKHRLDVHYMEDLISLPLRRPCDGSLRIHKHISDLVSYLHERRPTKVAFLIFLPGRREVERVWNALLRNFALFSSRAQVDICPVLGSQSIEVQERILGQDLNPAVRRLILATNVIESSVTIPDVGVVIDTCLHKRRCWDAGSKESLLSTERICQDEAQQRAGRAGRTSDGEVFRLITRSQFEEMRQHAEPQICNERLEEILLTLFEQPSLGEPRAFLRSVVQPPQEEHIDGCLVRFLEINAIVKDGDQMVLTHFGRFLKQMPLDPDVGNLVMNGLRYGIENECIVLAAIHQRGEPFLQECDMRMPDACAFHDARMACVDDLPSDLIAGLRAYQAWKRLLDIQGRKWRVTEEKQWCLNHFLSLAVLHEIEDLRVQIHDALRDSGYSTGICEIERGLMQNRRLRHARMKVALTRNSALSSKAAADIAKLLRHEREDTVKQKLLQWCIAASFLHGTVEVNSSDCSPTLKYEVWETFEEGKNDQTKNEERKEKREWLTSFLRNNNFPVKHARSGRGDSVFVTFDGPQAAQRALCVGGVLGADTALPFHRVQKVTKTSAKLRTRACFKKRCVIGAESLTAVSTEDHTVVAAATALPLRESGQKSNWFYLLSKCTTLPKCLIPIVTLATYHSIVATTDSENITLETWFHGAKEVFRVRKEGNTRILHLAQSIRAKLDTEFVPSLKEPIERQAIVNARKDAVLQIMDLLELVPQRGLLLAEMPTSSQTCA